MANFLFIFSDNAGEWNCSAHNCIRPAEAINKIPGHQSLCIHISDFVKKDEKVENLVMNSDLVIIERNLFDDALTQITYFKVRGKKFLAIWDDAYQIIEPQNVSYSFWNKGEVQAKNEKGEIVTYQMYVHPIQQLKWGLRLCENAIFPSPVLANDWKDYADVYVTHNYLKPEIYDNAVPLIPHDDIIIGWHGSLSHFESFTNSGVLKALLRVTRKYDNVRVLIGGDKRVYDRINLPENKKIFQPFVPEEQFGNALKTIDIGLAPLATEYDKRRSWIKVLEYMYLQTPWIASDFPTYSELKDYGILVENTSDAWEKALSDMIENYSAHKERAKGLPYEFAKEQTWDKNVHKLIKIYEEIIKKPYK